MLFEAFKALPARLWHLTKTILCGSFQGRRPGLKMLLVMKFTAFLIMVACLQATARDSFSQTVSLSFKNASLEKVFREIRKQTGYEFLYNTEMIGNSGTVSVNLKETPLYEALEACFRGLPLTYSVSDRMIVVKPRTYAVRGIQPPASEDAKPIRGRILDENGQPLAGANVAIKGSKLGATTNKNGEFSIDTTGASGTLVLQISFIGYQTRELVAMGNMDINVRLERTADDLKNVVVSTGMFTRKQETFTGSSTTVSGDQLKTITNQNIFQGLKVLDPSFVQLENTLMGSNPNQLPDLQIRGVSTLPDLKGEYSGNPNLPLFILDGFETDLTKIYDLDINRVASVTILKDAAAKAVYGARAANGVVVVETKRPARGKMRITYSGDMNVTAPDLTSYDLTNAAEKLEVERNAGRYTSTYQPQTQALTEQYNETYKDVVRGVNTYWLSQPVRTGVGQKHSLYLEGGDQALRYGVDVMYNNIKGVMKGSGRETVSGTVTLSYQYRNILFRNLLTVTFNRADDSPYGAFSEYSRLNPYWSAYDSIGKMKKVLGQFIPAGSLNTPIRYVNPLYNATLGTKNFSTYTEVTNNLYGEYSLAREWKVVGRFGFTDRKNAREDFYPANHTRFVGYADADFYKRGQYSITDGLARTIKTDLTLNYTKTLLKHQLMFNAGWNLMQTTNNTHGMVAQGFLNDRVDNINFARQYLENGRPSGTESTTRELGLLASLNYAYDERFLTDLSVRRSASSVFGSNNRWGTFWSAGLGWNIHNEHFLRGNKVVNLLKLRGSIGYTGSQNFNPYQSMATYDYYTDVYYDNVVSAKLLALANDNLKWQQTRDINLGVDMALLKKLNLRFEYYTSTSDNLLIDLTLPGSTGFTSYKQNLGAIQNKGIDAMLNYRVYSNVSKQSFVSVFVSAARNRNKIVKLSNALDTYNDEQDKSGSTKPLVRYKEGQSTSGIWAVQSLGIDPITGNEVFLSRDGRKTYNWDPNDQFVAGESAPQLSGSFGINAEYKGFGLNASCMYRFGLDYYNQTVVDRVENVDIQYNVDRRVFSDTWKKPGDVAIYKKITTSPVLTRATTRFIEKLHELQLTSLNVYYDFRGHAFLKKWGMSGLKTTFYMADVLRASTVRAERGLDFPFARTFSLSLKANF